MWLMSRIISIVLLLIGLINCTKDKSLDNTHGTSENEKANNKNNEVVKYASGSPEELFVEFYNESSHGNFQLRFDRGIGPKGYATFQNFLKAKGFVYDKLEGDPIPYGALTIGDKILEPASKSKNYMYGGGHNPIENYKDYMGQEVNINLKNNNGDEVLDTNVYNPEILYLDTLDEMNSEGDPIISSGTNLTWNPDANNSHGVIIALEYNPHVLENVELYEEGHKEAVLHYTYLEKDDGSHTLSSSMFEGIENGAFVSFYTIRGNYAMLRDSDDRKYKFFGVAYADGSAYYQSN